MGHLIWILTWLCSVQILVTRGEEMNTQTDYCSWSPCNCSVTVNKSIQADCKSLSLASVESANLTCCVNILLLGHNNLTTIKKKDFSKFPNLTVLDLSYNSINNLEAGAFSYISSLKFLNLENNSLELSNLSDDVFSGLSALQTLRLNNNTVSENYPDSALSKLDSLTVLFINGIYGLELGSGFRNLTKLTTLVLSGAEGYCNITSLGPTAFGNTAHLEILNISRCNLIRIHSQTFQPLIKLHTLDISSNYRLGFKAMGVGIKNLQPNFKVLKANNVVKRFTSCVMIMLEHISPLQNTSLTHLYLDDNEIESIQLGALPLLPKTLTFISALRNKFSYGSYLNELKTMTGLKDVILSGKSYPMTVPDYFNDDEESCDNSQCNNEDEQLEDYDVVSGAIQSRGQWIGDLQDHEETDVFNLTLPPNLEKIHSNFTQMTFHIGWIQFYAESLRYLDLSSNLVQFKTGQLRGLNKVTTIDLSNNLARQMSRELLVECEGLKKLDLSYNFFGWQIQSDINGTIFQNLSNLDTLVIANNDLQGLTGHVISSLTSLKTLLIPNNGMYDFSPEIKNLTKLQTIDASNNQIKWLRKATMDDLSHIKSQSPNFTFILRRNPLSCRCDQIDTLQWLYSSGVTPQNMGNYYCLMPDTTRRDFNTTEEFHDLIQEISDQCKNNFGLALGCVGIFIVLLGLMITAILYRYRWKLRYLYYAARLRYLAESIPEEDDQEFVFDAFVSYADEDRSFVINDMRARLEHESSMQLNIHHRDFMPGEPIVSNIVGAIKKSRKMLVLLSQNFLNSYWCRYELHMAQMESISTGRDIIIVIMYESVPAKNIPPEFLHLLQSDSYIEYPRNESDVPLFWNNLRSAVRHRSHRFGSQCSQITIS